MSPLLQGFQPGPHLEGLSGAAALWTSPQDHVTDALMGWVMWPFWELGFMGHLWQTRENPSFSYTPLPNHQQNLSDSVSNIYPESGLFLPPPLLEL